MEVQHVSVGEMLRQHIASAMEQKQGAPAPAETPEAPAELEQAAEPVGDAAPEETPAEQDAEEAADPEVRAEEAEEKPAKKAKKAAAPADLDKRLEKLNATSQKLIAERQKFADERKQFEKELAEAKRWKEIVENAKEDPVGLAELAGIEPDKYATLLLEKGSLTPERKRVLELEKRVRDLATEKQKEAEAAVARESKAMQEKVIGQIQEYLGSEGEKFELVTTLGRYQDVLNVIEKHYENTRDPDTGQGELLTYDQAAEIVENWLDSQLEPILKSSKVRNKLGSQQSGAETSAKASNQAAPRKSSGTITSKVRAQSSAPKEMTEAERMDAAGKLFFAQVMGKRG